MKSNTIMTMFKNAQMLILKESTGSTLAILPLEMGEQDITERIKEAIYEDNSAESAECVVINEALNITMDNFVKTDAVVKFSADVRDEEFDEDQTTLDFELSIAPVY